MNTAPFIDTNRINLFANALQLSVLSRILSVATAENGGLVIKMETYPGDTHWPIFQKIISGHWQKKDREWLLESASDALADDVINFMQLSRLVPENMKALAEIDARFRPFVERAGLSIRSADLPDIQDADQVIKIIFTMIKKRGLTLREVSHASGLTPMALHKIKNGADVRLSNLLRLCKAVGLTMNLSEKYIL